MRPDRSTCWNRPTPRRDGARAFTMVEVLVAMTILSIGMLVVSGSFSAASRAVARTRHMSGAAELAVGKLDEAATALPAEMTSASGSEGRYQWQRWFENKPHNLIKALVRVTWLQQGRTETLLLSRVIIPRGGNAASARMPEGEALCAMIE